GLPGDVVGLDELGGHRLAPEDVLVPVVRAIQHPAGDGVVEGLGALRALVVVEQRDQGLLHRWPERLVGACVGVTHEHRVHRLPPALVVGPDAQPAQLARTGSILLLEGLLRRGVQGAELGPALLEAVEDGTGDRLWSTHLAGSRPPTFWQDSPRVNA